MKELFTLFNLCSVEFFMDGLKYICCGKVNLQWCGLNIFGYVLEEVNGKWLVHCRNNEIMYISHIEYFRFTYENSNLEVYLYEFLIKCASGWIATSYWPIRIHVTENAVQNCMLMMIWLLFKDDKVYEQLSS